jgi:predicted porin
MTPRLAWTIPLLACCAAPAPAQTAITTYGLLGAALRHSSNADANGHSRTELSATNGGAGIWGVRGVEELGGGNQVNFKLETGFSVDTGNQRNNALFGREASVGASGPYGQLDLGRIQIVGGAAEVLVRIDPMRGAGQLETVWAGIWTGARFDNTVRYRRQFGPWLAGAMLSLGEQSNGAAAGRTGAVTAGYASGPLYALSNLQTAHDGNGRRANVVVAGANYIFSDLTLHGAWLRATRERGFLVGGSAGSALYNSDFSFAGIPAPAGQQTSLYLLGATVRLPGLWQLRSAWVQARSAHATLFNATMGGIQRGGYAVLSYELSRRTSLLASADYNHWSGGWAGFWGASAASLTALKPDGSDTRRTVSLGMLHRF